MAMTYADAVREAQDVSSKLRQMELDRPRLLAKRAEAMAVIERETSLEPIKAPPVGDEAPQVLDQSDGPAASEFFAIWPKANGAADALA